MHPPQREWCQCRTSAARRYSRHKSRQSSGDPSDHGAPPAPVAWIRLRAISEVRVRPARVRADAVRAEARLRELGEVARRKAQALRAHEAEATVVIELARALRLHVERRRARAVLAQ